MLHKYTYGLQQNTATVKSLDTEQYIILLYKKYRVKPQIWKEIWKIEPIFEYLFYEQFNTELYKNDVSFNKIKMQETFLQNYAKNNCKTVWNIDIHKLNPLLLKFIFVEWIKTESGFRQYAVSNKGSVGLLQIYQHVWGNVYDAKRFFDVKYNLKIGIEILYSYYKESGFNMYQALKKYNGGYTVYGYEYATNILRIACNNYIFYTTFMGVK